jgi:hypothetical protein
VLIVEGLRHHDRDPAQIVLGGVERLAAEVEQCAQRAALQRARNDRYGGAAGHVGDGKVLRIGGRRRGGQRIRLVADHQALAVADEDVVAAVGLLDHAGAHQLVQVGHHLVALVEQVVGRLGLVRMYSLDLEFELLYRMRLRVHLLHRVGELLVDAALNLCELGIQALKARRQHLTL